MSVSRKFRLAMHRAIMWGHASQKAEARRILQMPFAERRDVVLDLDRYSHLLEEDRERLVDSLISEGPAALLALRQRRRG